MRAFLICLFLFTAVCYSQKSDSWEKVYIVFDNHGVEVAKRFAEDSSWVIHDVAIALEKMYQEKCLYQKKYELAVGILKNLAPDGSIKDKKAYFESVSKYNSFQ